MNLKLFETVLVSLIAISEMSLLLKMWCYTILLINDYSFAGANFEILSQQPEAVISNSLGQLPTKVTFEGGGALGEKGRVSKSCVHAIFENLCRFLTKERETGKKTGTNFMYLSQFDQVFSSFT